MPKPWDQELLDRNIVHLLLQGRTNLEIATALGISDRTVDLHIAQLYKDHGISGRGLHKRLKLAMLLCPKPKAKP